MRIKNWNKFQESISGWELIGQHTMGPNYPEQKLHTGLSSVHTDVLMGIDGNLYTYDDFENIYIDYLKKGGDPLQGFNKKNLDIILSF